MPNQFFSYQYQDDGAELQIPDVVVDGAKMTDAVKFEDALIDVTADPTWKELVIRVKTILNPQLATEVLPTEEHSARPWRVLLLATSRIGGTRQVGWRQSELLSPDNGGDLAWSGGIRMRRDDVGTSVTLRGFVTRAAKATVDRPGFAGEPGLRLTASKEWTVQIEPIAARVGKAMKVEWINFRTCSKKILNKNLESLYHLDLDQDFPVLYLNEDVRDLKTVLNAQGHVGPRAAIRDTLFHSIAQPVWVCLAMVAVSTEDEERPEWQDSVLREIAPCVYQDVTEQADREYMLAEGRNPAGRTLLMQKLLPAIQSYLSLHKSTVRLFREALA